MVTNHTMKSWHQCSNDQRHYSKGTCKLTTSVYYHHLKRSRWFSLKNHYFSDMSERHLHLTLWKWQCPYGNYTLSLRIHHKAVSSDDFHSVLPSGRGYYHHHSSSLYKHYPENLILLWMHTHSKYIISIHRNLAYSHARGRIYKHFQIPLLSLYKCITSAVTV